MTRLVHKLLFTLALLLPPTLLWADAPEGRVILTIGGELDAPNAPGGSADDINVSGLLGLDYASGYAFDAAMLAALPQTEMARGLFGAAETTVYSGPRLADVLEAAGVAGQDVMPVALDGYQFPIPWAYVTEHDPLLATHGNGVPLAIGKLGPTLILFPVVEDPPLAEELAGMQVWATFFIGVGLEP